MFRAQRWKLYGLPSLAIAVAFLVVGARLMKVGQPGGLPLAVVGGADLLHSLLFLRARVVLRADRVKIVNRYRARTVRFVDVASVDPVQKLERWGGPFLVTTRGRRIRLVCCQRAWLAVGWGGLPSPDAGRLAHMLGLPATG